MPSLDFEAEKAVFRAFHDANVAVLQNGRSAFIGLLTSLLPATGPIPVSRIEARVKDREECIRKFDLKYRSALEDSKTPYAIKDHVTDLVGVRIVCLYEDHIEAIGRLLTQEFLVLGITDKVASVENTEGSFGYKGLHFDVRLSAPRLDLPEYQLYADIPFEIQVRTIVQDSWSVLDHQIKYKKAIPTALKRRINTLAALFELADREFREIRDATEEEIKREETEVEEADAADVLAPHGAGGPPRQSRSARLNAFNFQKIALHFFPAYAFEPHRVDGFVRELVSKAPEMTRASFNACMNRNIPTVRRYQAYFESAASNRMSPFTVIRHCLYLDDRSAYAGLLTAVAKENFEAWLAGGMPAARTAAVPAPHE